MLIFHHSLIFRTNVLDRYLNKDFTLTLPENKKITEIKWFAIYDLASQNTFGDIYIPEEFEPPSMQKISQITGTAHNVSSDSIEILDSKTIRLKEFNYDGEGKGICSIIIFPSKFKNFLYANSHKSNL